MPASVIPRADSKRGITAVGLDGPPFGCGQTWQDAHRLGLAQSSWYELVSDFGKLFSGGAAKPSVVDSMQPPHSHRTITVE